MLGRYLVLLCISAIDTASILQLLRTTQDGGCGDILVVEQDNPDNWHGLLALSPEDDISAWSVELTLDNEVTSILSPSASVSGSGKKWTLTSRDWDGNTGAGKVFELRFIVDYSGYKPLAIGVKFNNDIICTNDDPAPEPGQECSDKYSIDSEGDGFWQGSIVLQPEEDVHGWIVNVIFDTTVDKIDSAVATPTGSGTMWSLTSKGWDDDINAGHSLALAMIVNYSGAKPGITSITFNDNSVCSGGQNPSPGPDCSTVVSVDAQDSISWTGSMNLESPKPITSWTVDLTFDISAASIAASAADVSGSGTSWSLTNKEWDGGLNPGDVLKLTFLVGFNGNFPNVISASFNGKSLCSGGDPAPTTSGPTGGATTTTSQPVTDCPYGIIVVYDDGPLAGCPNFAITNEWDGGYNADLDIKVDHETTGWDLTLGFDKSFTLLDCYQGTVSTTDNQNFQVTNMEWDGELHDGETFKVQMQATYSAGGKPDLISADLDGSTVCGAGPTTTTTTTTTTQPGPTTTTCAPPPTKPEDTTTRPPTPDCTYRKWFNTTETKVTCDGLSKLTGAYPYGEVLCESMLFYEAERSGKLPADNRVPWRGDSALNDLVVGGYYDAGDFVKFGFPMASMTTMLAWGGVSFPDGYDASGQTEWFTKTLKWSTDYFIGAHLGDTEFVGQIGDGNSDHANWGRPEDMTMNRPAFKITASAPGSELAAETAAALASSAIWFRCNGYEDYANECLDHAKTLYTFADEHRGKYTDAIPNAADFYQSWSGYNDELVWGAAWLAKATGDDAYLAKAEAYYEEFGPFDPNEISWDDKSAGTFLILYELTGDSKYADKAEKFVDYFLNLEKTGKGLVWSSSSQWGSLRYAANYAHYALQAAKLGIKESESKSFAESQINYILGDTGRSYVVGWGVNPPTHCHHRAASCPDAPQVCDWSSGMNNPGPNPQVLHGALVGGPDNSDNYVDDRNQFQMTEVATDYNAGFQSVLAAMTSDYVNNQIGI